MRGLFRLAYCTSRYALLFPIFLYGMHLVTEQLFFVKTVECMLSGGSSQSILLLKQYVEGLRFYSAHRIVKEVLKQFPYIADITIARSVDQRMYCDALIKDNVYCVNDEDVVTVDGDLFAKSIFDPVLVEKTKKCSVSKDFLMHGKNSIFQWLDTVENSLFSSYRIHIENQYDIRFYPLDSDDYYLKFFLDSPFEKDSMDMAIKELLVMKKSSMYKNSACVVIDMRFKDQIIFTKEYKGTV